MILTHRLIRIPAKHPFPFLPGSSAIEQQSPSLPASKAIDQREIPETAGAFSPEAVVVKGSSRSLLADSSASAGDRCVIYMTLFIVLKLLYLCIHTYLL
jgi:hypothetical protein